MIFFGWHCLSQHYYVLNINNLKLRNNSHAKITPACIPKQQAIKKMKKGSSIITTKKGTNKMSELKIQIKSKILILDFVFLPSLQSVKSVTK